MRSLSILLSLVLVAACTSPGAVRISRGQGPKGGILPGLFPTLPLPGPTPPGGTDVTPGGSLPVPVEVPTPVPTPTPVLFPNPGVGGGGGGGGGGGASVLEVIALPVAFFLTPNATANLQAAVRLSNNTTNDQFTWSSTDPNVVTISPAGLVTAVAQGTATITVVSTADPTKFVYVPVTVGPVGLYQAVVVSPTSASRLVGSTYQLTATVYRSDNTSSNVVDWTSSNPTVATVSPTGLVTMLAPGNAEIRATPPGEVEPEATCQLTVTAVKAAVSVVVNTSSLTLQANTSQNLSATVEYNDGTTDNLVTWSSFTPSIATVDGTGTVTAVAVGPTVVRAASQLTPDVVADVPVTVEAPPGNQIQGTPSAIHTETNPGAWPRVFQFTGATAMDAENDPLTFRWELMEGGGTLSAATGTSTTLTVPSAGLHSVRLYARDPWGRETHKTYRFNVN